MFFKSKPPKHNLPFQFFFHKESRFHPVCGRLLVSSHKHDLKNEVIDFSIVGLSKLACVDVALINAIFEEARLAGFKPHALLYFSASHNDIARTFPDQHTGRFLKAKRLTTDPTNLARVFVQVRDYRNDETEYSYGIAVKQITDGKGDPFVTPDFVSLVFEYVKSQGLVPLDLLRVGEDALLEGMGEAISDLPEYLFSQKSPGVEFDKSQREGQHTPLNAKDVALGVDFAAEGAQSWSPELKTEALIEPSAFDSPAVTTHTGATTSPQVIRRRRSD